MSELVRETTESLLCLACLMVAIGCSTLILVGVFG